jgi:hypothetical protein
MDRGLLVDVAKVNPETVEPPNKDRKDTVETSS